MRSHFSPTYRVPSGTSRAKSEVVFSDLCFVASCEMAVAGRTGPNAVGIMPKVHDMWVNSLAALLGALAAIRSVVACRLHVSLSTMHMHKLSMNKLNLSLIAAIIALSLSLIA